MCALNAGRKQMRALNAGRKQKSTDKKRAAPGPYDLEPPSCPRFPSFQQQLQVAARDQLHLTVGRKRTRNPLTKKGRPQVYST